MDLCTILSYSGSVKPSHGIFYYKNKKEQEAALPVSRLHIRGSNSNFKKGYESSGRIKNTQPQDLAYGQPIQMDSCVAPAYVKEVFCRFSLNVHSHSLEPELCNDNSVFYKLEEFAKKYAGCGGFHELSKRMCKNILSGTWLFKNRFIKTSIVTSQ